MYGKKLLIYICLLIPVSLSGQIKSDAFAFEFENKTLHGLIEQPANLESKAIVLLIPGYGRTDFVEGNWYAGLRNQLASAGLTVVCWDKMGCGKSEGTFDEQQPVANSAQEALAAIAEIQKRKLSGSDQIGCWGISRAGWIVPLINQKFPINFWISVSGTDDKENFGYLVKSNLRIAGKSDSEVENLYQAWMKGHKLYCTGASFEAYLKAIEPLISDSLSRAMFNYSPVSVSEESIARFEEERRTYTSSGHFDQKSGLWTYINDFDQSLKEISCPVLALFGENDSQVDWRKTKLLYEQTIGKNGQTDLMTKVFPACNHSIQKCVSCAWQEDLSASRWAACDGYYALMIDWLRMQQLIE